jgi:hypothetical protein
MAETGPIRTASATTQSRATPVILRPVELSLTFRGFGEGNAADCSLCRSEQVAEVPKSPPGLCLRETVSRRELAALADVPQIRWALGVPPAHGENGVQLMRES